MSVDFILDLLANEWTHEKIFENYPQVTADDIKACLEYASQNIKEEKVLLM